MENISVPVNFVPVHMGDYSDLKEKSFVYERLVGALLEGIEVRDDFLDHDKPRISFDDDKADVLSLLKALVPDQYDAFVEDRTIKWKLAKKAAASDD